MAGLTYSLQKLYNFKMINCSLSKGIPLGRPGIIEIEIAAIAIEIEKLPEIDFDHDFDFDTDPEHLWLENNLALTGKTCLAIGGHCGNGITCLANTPVHALDCIPACV